MPAPLTNLAPAILFSDERKVIASSPFPADWSQMRAQFAQGEHRSKLADSFERWVKAVNALVQVDFVWIGGSFACNKPKPADIDAVLFYRHRQDLDQPALWNAFLSQHADLFGRDAIKEQYRVDAATLLLTSSVTNLIHMSAYWAMVFSNGPDATRRAFFSVTGDSILK